MTKRNTADLHVMREWVVKKYRNIHYKPYHQTDFKREQALVIIRQCQFS